MKSTVGARIGCTPYTTPAYGQTCVRTLPYEYAVVNSTTGNWAHLTSKHLKVLKKWGKVIMVESRRVFVLFLILGRRTDHPMIFHIFPYLFYHRFLVSNCSKFCVKQMGSTVRHCGLSRSLVKIRLQDTSLPPFFQNTPFYLFDFILKGCCIIKKRIYKKSSTWSSLPLCILFTVFSIFHSN